MSFCSRVLGFGGALCAEPKPAPAPGNWYPGGAPAPPCCSADMSAAIGSSEVEGAAVEDAAVVDAAAVEDDEVDVARGRGCSVPTPGSWPDAAAPRKAFMSCCCCSSDQIEGSGVADPRPAAANGEVCESLALRVPGVEADGVGMSDVSPRKFVRPWFSGGVAR